ncbi:MAG: peptidylprolyl isomerase [Pseudomonadota bacterium]|nr:peptidylprolyl isomerase [Pseudomonadota bacterium]
MNLFITSIFLISTLAQAELVEKIVAVVNDEIITLSDLTKYKSRLGKGVLFDDLLTQGQDIKAIAGDQKKLISLLVDEKILDSEIKKQGLAITIERVEKEIRNISKTNNMSRVQLKEVLKGQGVDFSDYQGVIKSRLERQGLIEKNVTSKIQISDEEVASYRGDDASAPEGQLNEYTISHILIKFPKGGEARAKKQAQEILARLRKGSPFQKVAEDSSEDPNFSKGGLLGSFKDGELLKEFERPVKALTVGQYSEVVKTKLGFHILMLNDKKTIQNPVAQKEREKIRGLLTQRAFQKQFRIWLDQRRQEAFVRINVS